MSLIELDSARHSDIYSSMLPFAGNNVYYTAWTVCSVAFSCSFLSPRAPVPRDERGESRGGERRRQQLPPHLRHPERRPSDGLRHHAAPHHLLRTDTAGIAGPKRGWRPVWEPRLFFCTSLGFWKVLLLCGRNTHTRTHNVERIGVVPSSSPFDPFPPTVWHQLMITDPVMMFSMGSCS